MPGVLVQPIFSLAKPKKVFKYFSKFFLYTAIFQMLIGLGHLPIIMELPGIFPIVFNWAYIVGHIFLYLGMAYFIYVPSYIYLENSNFAKKLAVVYFYLILFAGLIITIFNILNPLTSSYVNHTSGLTILNVPESVGQLIPIIVLFAWAPAALLFLYKAVSPRGFARFRSLFFGVGLIVIIIGWPMHDVARELVQYLIADILALVGFLLLFFGVFMEKKTQLKILQIF